MARDDATTFEMPGTAQRRAARPRAYVAVVSGAEPRIVPLPRGTEVTVGRSPSSDVHVDDRAVSRLQCTLRWDGAATVRLVDHASRNGTFVDGQRVEAGADLGPGAEVEVGPARLVVSVAAEAADRGEAPPAHPGLRADDGDPVVADDPRMLSALALVAKAARTEVPLLLEGEAGTGKGLLARRVHDLGPRAARPFVTVDCGAVPAELQGATLAGERGGRPGAFAEANGGTLYLGHVEELAPDAQTRLLGALRDGAVVPVGAREPVPADVRVIASTPRDLREAAERGAFREDLFYRLDVMRIAVPPLRERPLDVAALAERFLRERAGERRLAFSPAALAALEAHGWPGNVRELRNAVERAVAVADGVLVGPAELGLRRDSTPPPSRPPAPDRELRDQVGDAERDAIVAALTAEAGNQTRAAARLGIARRTLIYKMERFGLKKPPARR